MLTRGNILELVPFVIILTVILTFPIAQIYASENVKWKTFKVKNGLFTIKYPSNWIPQKIDEYEGVEVNSPISMFFAYTGGGSSGAQISIVADESIFTNATDSVESIIAYAQSLPNYKLLEPMECGKYMIKGISACSTITYKNVELPGKPMVKELDIGTIDEEGIEYLISYMSTKDLFDDFLPVVDEMVRSFNVTGDILSSEESTGGTEDSPELPTLTQSPRFKKL